MVVPVDAGGNLPSATATSGLFSCPCLNVQVRAIESSAPSKPGNVLTSAHGSHGEALLLQLAQDGIRIVSVQLYTLHACHETGFPTLCVSRRHIHLWFPERR